MVNEQVKDYYSQEDLVLPMLSALKDDDLEALRAMLAENHPSEIAELLNLSEADDRERIIAVLGELDPEILTFLDDEIRDDVLKIIGTQSVAEAIEELESDDAVQLVQDLPDEQIEEILEGLSIEKRQEVVESLNYPEESAGRLANKQYVTISDFASVGDVIDLMRVSENLPQDFYTIFVVDDEGRPTHYIPLSRIMRNKREVKVSDLMQEIIKEIPVETDQEEVANIFQKYGLISAPVVNHNGKMVGVITVDDITYIIKQEAEEDILGMVGLTSQKDMFGSVIKRFSNRSPWLFINLITAFSVSFIISFFEKSIAELVALATLMPIVASMSGNCGTQTLTITVRAIATKDLSSSNFLRMLKREIFTAILIAIALGSAVFLVSFLMYNNYLLSAIIFSAIILTFFLASISGCTIPFIMQKLGFDPAVASSVLLTAITDISSFFIFLALATKIILH